MRVVCVGEGGAWNGGGESGAWGWGWCVECGGMEATSVRAVARERVLADSRQQ